MKSHFCGRAAWALVLSTLLVSGCGRADPAVPAASAPSLSAKVDRTSFGVVHVQGNDFRSLGYGLAYAYAQDNVCMFADTLLTVRGERSRYFGPAAGATAPSNGEYGAAIDYLHLNNEDSDFFFRGYLDLEQLRASYAGGSREARDMLAGYAAGYNRYLKDHAGRLPKACAQASWVRPITIDDMYLVVAEKALHASGEVFAKEIVNAAREHPGAVASATPSMVDAGFLRRRLDRLTSEQLGSNALAFGRETTANGKGLLLGNPHYPWTSTDRFYQAHLTVPGRYDAMGVILGGIPIVVIGFNRNLAWTHTVSTSVHFNTFRLQLDRRDPSGTTYLMDGQPHKMSSRTVTVEMLQADGSVRTRSKTFYFTKQGAVIVKPDAGLTWTNDAVHVLADANRANTRLIEQWIGIGSARNVSELKASLDKVTGLPWVNTIAADRDGTTLFADASAVPYIGPERFAGDCLLAPALLMFDGSRSQCGWASDPAGQGGLQPAAQAPWTIRDDYVGNSNDSYWMHHGHVRMTASRPQGYSPLYGPLAVPQKLRSRIGFLQVEQALAAGKMTLAELQRLTFANRVHAAELILPELLSHCASSADGLLVQACGALAGWDRRADLDSRGAVLFREFWNSASSTPTLWAIPFSPSDPLNTPRGVAPDALPQLTTALAQAARKLLELGIPLNARLGDYQTETRNGVRIGVHGAIGDIDGSYNSIHMRTGLGAEGYRDIAWGTSYVQTVTFDADGPVAHGMLVYGQSVDPASPHYADQVPVYARKEWPTLPFSANAIRADSNFSSITLSE